MENLNTLEYLKCTITFWIDDVESYQTELNFLSDLWGMIPHWLNDSVYTKATINWQGKIITINPRLGYPNIRVLNS
jgi:hypothetical protein